MNRMIYIVVFAILFTTACNSSTSHDTDQSFAIEGELTRIDVQKLILEGNPEDEFIIFEAEMLTSLQESFQKISWDPGVEAEMSRKEDVLLTLFYKIDRNMPERLYQYRIWFNENDTVTIISNHVQQEFGTLGVEETGRLLDQLQN